MQKYLFLILLLPTLISCRALRDSPKYKFNDGVYKTIENGQRGKVYVENKDDSIYIYKLKNNNAEPASAHKQTAPKVYPGRQSGEVIASRKYWKQGLDVDVLTIPFKYRRPTGNFPRQLSNQLNGAVYVGYRNDIYELAYQQNPIGQLSQQITHLGFSAGLATGIGFTAMNPWVTRDSINIEYDGFIWTKAISFILAVDKLNFGLALGIDHLLDQNRRYWIYQGKPYLGLTVGLNLN